MASGKAELMRFEDRTLTEAILRVAEEELGENQEVRDDCLRLLRNEINDLPDFHPRTEDDFLLRFLRVAKFNVSKALCKLDTYYKNRVDYAEVFDKLLPATTRGLIAERRTNFILPKRNNDDSVITVLVLKRSLTMEDRSSFNFQNDLRSNLMLLECVTDQPVSQICGVTCIIDYEGLTLRKCLPLCTPGNIHLSLNTCLAIPLRIKQVHVVNAPGFFKLLYNMAYPFISDKLRNRIAIHRKSDDWKVLHSHIAPEALPEEFGGRSGPLDCALFLNLLLEREHRFKEDLKYGYVVEQYVPQ